MKQLHYIQRQILNKLLFSEGLKFSELKPDEKLENNQFTFHLKELLRARLIQKEKNIYKLTIKGKEYANTMDTDNAQVMKQAKVSAISCLIKKTKGGYEYLIYTRLKQPFFGRQGFPSGKVKWGERITDACKREMEEETGLSIKPELFKISHQMVFKIPGHELIEDKIFFFFRALNPKGKLIPNNEGKYEWVAEKDLNEYIKKPFE